MNAQIEEILKFVEGANFNRGYQKITLPNGTIISGNDRSSVANQIYPERLDEKTVMDVGCDYGFFLHNAIERGAKRAVGVELNDSNYEIASTIAPLWDGKVEIKHGLIEDMEFDEKFDYILFLNVIHHVKNPVAVMRKLAGLCRETLVVEFRQPYDVQFLTERDKLRQLNVGNRVLCKLRRIRAQIKSNVIRSVTKGVPLMGVGSVEFHRVCYYNELAFRNMFIVHHKLFRDVKFKRSHKNKGGQILAFCDCRD